MQNLIRYVCLASLLFLAKPVVSQVEVLDNLPPDPEMHITRQHSYFGHIHSGGFGLGFRWGNIRSVERYTFQEAEFLQLRHPRAERNPGRGAIGTPRRYIYGGINQLFALRYGIGFQRTLSEKPYWGGIQVDYTLSFGAVLGLAIPQYLSILHHDTTRPIGQQWYTRVERFDYTNPDHTEWQFINGMGPLFRGLFNLRPYPGLYARFGFNFDFGRYQERVSALEVGIMVDVFPWPVPMMAREPRGRPGYLEADRNFFFFNFYIAYHFGRRR